MLLAHPTTRGVLLDAPRVLGAATDTLAAAGVADRCRLVEGDFFDEVPAGGDVYVLQRIVHDWDDDRAGRVLANCRRAMGDGAELLLVEKLMPERAEQAPAVVRLDLDMLVEVGGCQRTEAEYGALSDGAELTLPRVVAADAETSILVAAPA